MSRSLGINHVYVVNLYLSSEEGLLRRESVPGSPVPVAAPTRPGFG